MPSYSSGKGRTSAIFYRRGVPNSFTSFGVLTQANYPIVQPQYPYYTFLRSVNKRYNF
jgi:hypothetical protein